MIESTHVCNGGNTTFSQADVCTVGAYDIHLTFDNTDMDGVDTTS